jgi:hypothetical protein
LNSSSTFFFSATYGRVAGLSGYREIDREEVPPADLIDVAVVARFSRRGQGPTRDA